MRLDNKDYNDSEWICCLNKWFYFLAKRLKNPFCLKLSRLDRKLPILTIIYKMGP